MRLEKFENGTILIHETGCQNNKLLYDSRGALSNYKRRNLSYYELFLAKEGCQEEAARIKDYLGKIIRGGDIPKVIPTGHYRVNTQLNFMLENLARYKEHYGLDLDPDFQRPHVWTMDQRVAYMEFICQDGESNPIYFNCPGWMGGNERKQMVIVDGKQRLTSIIMFLNNEFPIFKHLDPEGEGYYAKDFDRISWDVVFVVNNLPTRAQVLQWYLEMNKGNVAHTKEEIEKVEAMLNDAKKSEQ